MKIASTNIDTVIGSSDGSIIITTTDDNFEKSDIKSITFTSDEISSTQIIKGGTYRKKFSAYKFEKIGPKQLQAWFYASYEDSSRVYYLSIMKTDSTVWLPTEGQKIVVINALLGAEDANCDGLIRVEPNPANSDSYLVFGAGLVGETELAIVGLDGSETKTRILVNNQTAETKLPLSDFVCSPGVYLIRCTNGAKSQTIKTVFLK